MAFSAKHFEIVSTVKSGFTEAKIKAVLADLPCKYAYCLHDKDRLETGELKEPHYHVYVNFGQTSWQSDRLAVRFGVAENFVAKVKGRAGDMLAYLTHQNAPEKYQYPEDDVISNYDWHTVKDKTLTKRGKEKRAEEIRENIVNGSWRDYNIHEFVTAKEYFEHKRVIDNAFEYRIRTLKGVNRNMKAVYIYGDSGTGKTTLAKQIAKEHNWSVYISSGSNDVLDDYRGEDCIILDDLRPSCMGLSDLLKMLDPNTGSTVKSRYKNKVLECKMILITTTLPIKAFFSKVFESEQETSVQLQRRCELKVWLSQSGMVQSIWNPAKREYLELPPLPNPVLETFKPENLSREEAMMKAAEIMGSIGTYSMALSEAIKSGDFEQLPIDTETPFD